MEVLSCRLTPPDRSRRDIWAPPAAAPPLPPPDGDAVERSHMEVLSCRLTPPDRSRRDIWAPPAAAPPPTFARAVPCSQDKTTCSFFPAVPTKRSCFPPSQSPSR